MSRSFCPRLSEARHLLPPLRSHLVAAASRTPLAAGLALDLLPLVEDGLFGYELVPDRDADTYVTIGCNAQGEPLLRKTSYGVGADHALQLVAVNGQILARQERAARYSTQQRESQFSDWPVVADAAWVQLLLLFPARPRQPVVVREHMHRCLDEALSIAHSHLTPWNPFIEFCGLPNEAEHGFALKGRKASMESWYFSGRTSGCCVGKLRRRPSTNHGPSCYLTRMRPALLVYTIARPSSTMQARTACSRRNARIRTRQRRNAASC
jgi:hypothetical protein